MPFVHFTIPLKEADFLRNREARLFCIIKKECKLWKQKITREQVLETMANANQGGRL